MHLTERFTSQPWHIHPQSIISMIQRLEIASRTSQPNGLMLSDFIEQRQPMQITSEGLAIIHVCGTLGRNLLPYEKLWGDTDYNDIIAEVGAAASNPAVRAILVIGNSGGGSVVGAAECREAVAEAARVKPLVWYTEGMVASACYEIAAPATRLYGSPSSIWGSIGTITMLADYSEYFAQFGVKYHVIPATKSDLKSTYFPQSAPTDEQKAEVLRFVDRWNEDFMGFVRAHRIEVTDDSMRGQAFDAREAADRGLIDDTCDLDTAMDEALAMADER